MFFFDKASTEKKGDPIQTSYDSALFLGGKIDKTNIDSFRDDLKKIDKFLDADDKIIFFSCHTGQLDQRGNNTFIGKFAKYTGAEVYANQSWTPSATIFSKPSAGYSNKYTYSERKYAYDNAGDWTVAKPDQSTKSGYKLKEIGAVSFKSPGKVTFVNDWKAQNVDRYYRIVGWKGKNELTLK